MKSKTGLALACLMISTSTLAVAQPRLDTAGDDRINAEKSVPRQPGVYVKIDGNLVGMQASQFEEKEDNMLLGHLKNQVGMGAKARREFKGPRAAIRLTGDVEFYFYESKDTASVSYNPQLFTLTKLDSGRKKREATTWNVSLVKTQLGLSSLGLRAEKIPGGYKVVPMQALEPGEYAIFSAQAPSFAYDFGVDR